MDLQLIGISPEVREIEYEIDVVACSDAKVLITGETGVGKDVIARLIHKRGQRRGPFVTISCAGFPDVRLKQTLSRHVLDARPEAGGTVVLEDVGDMSLDMQGWLLGAFEADELEYARQAYTRRSESVRVVATTDRNLLKDVARGRFREDLYYRLNIVHLVVPPLRERPDDIAPLLTYFLEAFSCTYRVSTPQLSRDALTQLTSYAWPGNVRELSNVVEQLVVRQHGGVISSGDLPLEISEGIASPVLLSSERTAAQASRLRP